MAEHSDKPGANLHWVEPWWFYRRRIRRDWSTTPFSKAGYWVRMLGVVVVLLGLLFVAVSVISGSSVQALTALPWWKILVIGLIAPALPAVLASVHVLMPRLFYFQEDGFLGLQGQAKVHLKYGVADSAEIVEHSSGQRELVICYLNRKGKRGTVSIGIRGTVDHEQLSRAIDRLKRPAPSAAEESDSPAMREGCTVTHDPLAF